MESDQESDLSLLFEIWAQIKKLSEIKLPLVVIVHAEKIQDLIYLTSRCPESSHATLDSPTSFQDIAVGDIGTTSWLCLFLSLISIYIKNASSACLYSCSCRILWSTQFKSFKYPFMIFKDGLEPFIFKAVFWVNQGQEWLRKHDFKDE